jgi:hypothetical protein
LKHRHDAPASLYYRICSQNTYPVAGRKRETHRFDGFFGGHGLSPEKARHRAVFISKRWRTHPINQYGSADHLGRNTWVGQTAVRLRHGTGDIDASAKDSAASILYSRKDENMCVPMSSVTIRPCAWTWPLARVAAPSAVAPQMMSQGTFFSDPP